MDLQERDRLSYFIRQRTANLSDEDLDEYEQLLRKEIAELEEEDKRF